MSKRPRTLDSFFGTPAKKSKLDSDGKVLEAEDHNAVNPTGKVSNHATYPFAVPYIPPDIRETLNFVPAVEGRLINDQPDLDLIYFQPFLPKEITQKLFKFLRQELFFYRVKYNIKRGPVETTINTPRFTTVFGIDETARFVDGQIVDAASGQVLPPETYKCMPRPLPECLDTLRKLTQNVTGCKFNFALVNYYSSGDDSISYHSDDEKFLGPDPTIASFSMGARRDFLLKHKPTPSKHECENKPIKFPLASGDMILMRGKTQSNWLHSLPKRKGGESDLGRINITLRRAMVKGGTENYYRYNVGDGGNINRWNAQSLEMALWNKN